jgi:hypothetical protein
VKLNRWTKDDMRASLVDAPAFTDGWVADGALDALARRYEQITGDPVRRPAKRNLLAGCFRVHGDDTLAFIEDEYRRTGSAINLLGRVRTTPPRGAQPAPIAGATSGDFRPTPSCASASSHGGPPCSSAVCLPNLTYCNAHRPPFDPHSRQGWDRR